MKITIPFLLFIFDLLFVIQSTKLSRIVSLGMVVRPDQRINPSFRIPETVAGFHPILIAKTMSTTMKVVFCDLMRRQQGLPPRRIITGRESTTCSDNNWYRDSSPRALKWETSGNHPSLIVLRDPIDRFISIYGHLCKNAQRKSVCPKRMSIHRFARWIYGKLIERSNGLEVERDTIIGHSQPSFWFAYEREESLPNNLDIIYQSPNPRANARELLKIFLKRHVPKGIARSVTNWVADSRINSRHKRIDRRRTRNWENQIYANRQTLITVLRAYYNDYRLLKIPLSRKLLKALKRHRIELPDEIEEISDDQTIIKDDCDGSRVLLDDGRSLPQIFC